MEKRVMLTVQDQAHNVFENYRYEDEGMKPSIYFWKHIKGANDPPSVLIPDTLIINDGQSLLWVYSDQRGRVATSTNKTLKDFISKVTAYCSPNQLCCTQKRLTIKQGNCNYGNDIKLVNTRYLHNMSLQQIGDQVTSLQKYIKSHGERAFICRTVFKAQGSPYCFLITSKYTFQDQSAQQQRRFLVSATKNGQFGARATLVRSSTGKNLKETLPYLKDIVRFMREQKGVTINQLVGDFIKDEQGNWWLVNIKAFKLSPPKLTKAVKSTGMLQIRLTDKQRYQKTKQCGYCQKCYLQSQLTHKMTKRMLIQMDSYLLHMGKNFKWLGRSDYIIDPHCLYQQFKICQRCYRLYIQIQGLLNFQGTFLKRLGMLSECEPKDVLLKLTSKQQLQIQSKDKQIHHLKQQIPQQIALGPNSSIITRNGFPIRNDQAINQMLRYRFMIYLHELDELSGVKSSCNYYLEFHIFTNKFRFKLDLSPKFKSAAVKKLRLCYFFVQAGKQNSLNQYLNQLQNIQISLIQENRSDNTQKKTIGYLRLDAREYLGGGKKNFYKFLDLGWGLEGSIGLIRSPVLINTARLILSTKDKLIYTPSQEYYLCQPLPQEWIDEIINKNQSKNLVKTKSTMQDTMMSNQCFKFTQTGQYFIPDRASQVKQNVAPKVDWNNVLQGQIEAYCRRR